MIQLQVPIVCACVYRTAIESMSYRFLFFLSLFLFCFHLFSIKFRREKKLIDKISLVNMPPKTAKRLFACPRKPVRSGWKLLKEIHRNWQKHRLAFRLFDQQISIGSNDISRGYGIIADELIILQSTKKKFGRNQYTPSGKSILFIDRVQSLSFAIKKNNFFSVCASFFSWHFEWICQICGTIFINT